MGDGKGCGLFLFITVLIDIAYKIIDNVKVILHQTPYTIKVFQAICLVYLFHCQEKELIPQMLKHSKTIQRWIWEVFQGNFRWHQKDLVVVEHLFLILEMLRKIDIKRDLDLQYSFHNVEIKREFNQLHFRQFFLPVDGVLI